MNKFSNLLVVRTKTEHNSLQQNSPYSFSLVGTKPPLQKRNNT